MIQLNIPQTKVTWTPITLSDTHPATQVKTQYKFPREMRAFPLTSNGGQHEGSGPDGKAEWWPAFQERHKRSGKLFWVQGHMLNDKVHGPGRPYNLVPISNTLNTNMEALVENAVKKMIDQGRYLLYVVRAHWEGAKDPQDHPRVVRETYGLIGYDKDGTLLWGEQFAPTRLSWSVQEWVADPKTGQLLATPVIDPNHLYKGATAHSYDASQWANNFPGPKD